MAYKILDERDVPVFNKNYSNAIVGNLHGNIVSANDVSPNEHEMAVKVRSKNLIPYPYKDTTKELNGITYTDNGDGSVTVNGTATAGTTFSLNSRFSLDSAGVYMLSGCPENGSGSTYMLALNYYSDDVEKTGVRDNGNGYTISFQEATDIKLYIWVAAGQTVSNLTFRPQLEKGDTATDYSLYVDPASATVKRCGKNIIPYPYAESSVSRSGITYTTDGEGKVTANGTSTGSYFNVITSASKKLYFHAGVTYRLSGVPAKTGLYYAYAKDAAGTNYFDYGEGASFIPSVSGYGAVTIVISTDATVDNVVFAPQIEVGSETTSRELYKGATYTPSADGTVEGMTSLAPSMTIFTETEGTVVECEYAKDTATVIEKLTNAIIALGGSV